MKDREILLLGVIGIGAFLLTRNGMPLAPLVGNVAPNRNTMLPPAGARTYYGTGQTNPLTVLIGGITGLATTLGKVFTQPSRSTGSQPATPTGITTATIPTATMLLPNQSDPSAWLSTAPAVTDDQSFLPFAPLTVDPSSLSLLIDATPADLGNGNNV